MESLGLKPLLEFASVTHGASAFWISEKFLRHLNHCFLNNESQWKIIKQDIIFYETTTRILSQCLPNEILTLLQSYEILICNILTLQNETKDQIRVEQESQFSPAQFSEHRDVLLHCILSKFASLEIQEKGSQTKLSHPILMNLIKLFSEEVKSTDLLEIAMQAIVAVLHYDGCSSISATLIALETLYCLHTKAGSPHEAFEVNLETALRLICSHSLAGNNGYKQIFGEKVRYIDGDSVTFMSLLVNSFVQACHTYSLSSEETRKLLCQAFLSEQTCPTLRKRLQYNLLLWHGFVTSSRYQIKSSDYSHPFLLQLQEDLKSLCSEAANTDIDLLTSGFAVIMELAPSHFLSTEFGVAMINVFGNCTGTQRFWALYVRFLTNLNDIEQFWQTIITLIQGNKASCDLSFISTDEVIMSLEASGRTLTLGNVRNHIQAFFPEIIDAANVNSFPREQLIHLYHALIIYLEAAPMTSDVLSTAFATLVQALRENIFKASTFKPTERNMHILLSHLIPFALRHRQLNFVKASSKTILQMPVVHQESSDTQGPTNDQLIYDIRQDETLKLIAIEAGNFVVTSLSCSRQKIDGNGQPTYPSLSPQATGGIAALLFILEEKEVSGDIIVLLRSVLENFPLSAYLPSHCPTQILWKCLKRDLTHPTVTTACLKLLMHGEWQSVADYLQSHTHDLRCQFQKIILKVLSTMITPNTHDNTLQDLHILRKAICAVHFLSRFFERRQEAQQICASSPNIAVTQETTEKGKEDIVSAEKNFLRQTFLNLQQIHEYLSLTEREALLNILEKLIDIISFIDARDFFKESIWSLLQSLVPEHLIWVCPKPQLKATQKIVTDLLCLVQPKFEEILTWAQQCRHALEEWELVAADVVQGDHVSIAQELLISIILSLHRDSDNLGEQYFGSWSELEVSENRSRLITLFFLSATAEQHSCWSVRRWPASVTLRYILESKERAHGLRLDRCGQVVTICEAAIGEKINNEEHFSKFILGYVEYSKNIMTNLIDAYIAMQIEQMVEHMTTLKYHVEIGIQILFFWKSFFTSTSNLSNIRTKFRTTLVHIQALIESLHSIFGVLVRTLRSIRFVSDHGALANSDIVQIEETAQSLLLSEGAVFLVTVTNFIVLDEQFINDYLIHVLFHNSHVVNDLLSLILLSFPAGMSVKQAHHISQRMVEFLKFMRHLNKLARSRDKYFLHPLQNTVQILQRMLPKERATHSMDNFEDLLKSRSLQMVMNELHHVRHMLGTASAA